MDMNCVLRVAAKHSCSLVLNRNGTGNGGLINPNDVRIV